jgi:rhodanese-related sulfurtransferase
MKIVDVREYPEFAAGAAADAVNAPLSSLESNVGPWPRTEPYLVMCKTGRRAAQAASRMRKMGFSDVTVFVPAPEASVQGQGAGKAPMSLERQVRIAAGALVAISATLGLAVHPYFFGLTLFVGCGLVFAGITNICAMATLLGKMPWNRAPLAPLAGVENQFSGVPISGSANPERLAPPSCGIGNNG